MREPDSSPTNSEYFKENRAHWEEMVQDLSITDSIDAISEFLAGKSALLPIQKKELGDVDGKTLLDLQSHIGIRTLSWAIGLGILLDWDMFNQNSTGSNSSSAVLLGLAAAAFFVGAAIAIA